MAYEFPTEDLIPGQIEEVPQADGSVIRYQWTDPPGVWNILNTGGGGGIEGPITTADILTMGARPTVVTNPFDTTEDPLQTQQNANWYLWDAIEELQEGDIDTSGLVTQLEFETDQQRQDDAFVTQLEFTADQERQDNEFVTKSEFTADQERQDNEFVTKPEFTADQQRQDNEIESLETKVEALESGSVDLSDYATIAYSDAEDEQLLNKIEELEVTKGSVAVYEVKSTTGGVASRNGEVLFNAPAAVNVNFVSFAAFDSNGDQTKLCATGDIVEFISVETNKVTRFKITTGGDPQALLVEYLGGNNDFVVGEQHETFIYPQNEQGASIDYVDTQDNLKLNKSGGTLTGVLYSKTGATGGSSFKINNQNDGSQCWTLWCPGGPGTQIKYVGQNNTAHWFQLYDATNKNPVTPAKFGYQGFELQAEPNVTYTGTDAHYFKSKVFFNDTSGETNLSINDDNADFYTFPRFKEGFNVKATGESISGANSFSAFPDHTSYSGRIKNDTDIVNKLYVDGKSGFPVGAVIMWFGTNAPNGWLICDGRSFNTNTYADLHAHLQTVNNYSSGITPDFRGLYPGGAGSAHNNQLTSGGENKTNVYHSQRTAKPFGGAPSTSSNNIPNGNTRSFNATGNTNAYSDGVARIYITEGWDNVNRPPTLSVHFIIKT